MLGGEWLVASGGWLDIGHWSFYFRKQVFSLQLSHDPPEGVIGLIDQRARLAHSRQIVEFPLGDGRLDLVLGNDAYAGGGEGRFVGHLEVWMVAGGDG